MVSLSVSSVKNNMLAAYLDNKIFPQPPSSPHKKIHSLSSSVKIGCGVVIISGISHIQIGCNSFVSFRFSANNILILSLYFASIRSFP